MERLESAWSCASGAASTQSSQCELLSGQPVVSSFTHTRSDEPPEGAA
jgi:hypothetical protein